MLLMETKEVRNLYASDFSVFVREEEVLRELKFPADPEVFLWILF